jgi:hypothetical protein
MFLKKSCLALAIIPVIFSCALPGSVSTNTLATKADAIKYFECALNNPGLTEDQKTNIRTAVIAQINLVPDATWAQAKAGFEGFAKTFTCNDGANPAASPAASGPGISSPLPSGAAQASGTIIVNNKEEYKALLQCAYDNMKAQNSKDPSVVLLGIELLSQLNASRFLDDATFVQQKAGLNATALKFKPYCTNPGAAPSPSAGPLTPVKVVSGVTEYSCDAEKTLKSASGPSINITFVNNSSGSVKIYWLDQSGTRRSYNANLAKGAKHPQQTFVTHPWLITDASDKCLKIFVPTDASANGANIGI